MKFVHYFLIFRGIQILRFIIFLLIGKVYKNFIPVSARIIMIIYWLLVIFCGKNTDFGRNSELSADFAK